MLLSEFLASANLALRDLRNYTSGYSGYGTARVVGRVWEEFIPSQPGFSMSLYVKSIHGTRRLKLVMKLTPEHPFYHPWLKPSRSRTSQLIGQSVGGLHTPPTFVLPEGQQDLPLESMLEALEAQLMAVVSRIDRQLRELDTTLTAHQLSPFDADRLFQAFLLIQSETNIVPEQLLSPASRDALLGPR